MCSCHFFDGIVFGRIGVTFGRIGIVFGRIDIVFGSIDIVFGRIGIALCRNGIVIGRIGITFGRTGIAFGRTGIAFGRTGIVFGRIAFGRTGSVFGRTGIVFGRAGIPFVRLLHYVPEQRLPSVARRWREVLSQLLLPDEYQRLDEHVKVLNRKPRPARMVGSDGSHERTHLRGQAVDFLDDGSDGVDEPTRVSLERRAVDEVVSPRRAEFECLLDPRLNLEDTQEDLLADVGAPWLHLSPRFSDELLFLRVECGARTLLLLMLSKVQNLDEGAGRWLHHD